MAAHAQTPPTPAPAPAVNGSALAFYSPRTVLWLGRTAVVPFHTAQVSTDDHTFSASVADPTVAEVVREPALLSNSTTGYLRVRALRAGHTQLTLQGHAAIDLEVQPDPAGSAFARIDVESTRPRIVSPMPDAVVWGAFAVGVEVFDAAELRPDQPVVGVENPPLSSPSPSPSSAPVVPPTANKTALAAAPATPTPTPAAAVNIAASPDNAPTIRLRLPDGRLLDPIARTGPESGPMRHYQFNVPADELAAGPLPLVAVSTPTGFTDVDRRAGRGQSLESQPLTVRNLRTVNANALLAGECESQDILGTTKDLYAPARPARHGTRQAEIRKDAAASGGQAVGGPDWCLPVVLKEPGEFQFFIQARGDFGAGAFASASLYLDNSEAPLGTVRLTGPKYQRLPVGVPFHLDAGPQILTVAFRNGFGHGKENRNFTLDRYELARVPPEAPAVPVPAAHGVTTVPTVAPGQYTLASLPLPNSVPPHPERALSAARAEVYGVDAVIGRFSGPSDDNFKPTGVDVLIDGQPQGVRLPPGSDPAAPLVFPLLLRQIAPGPHRLALRATDTAGRAVDSPAQPLTVLADPPFARGPYERAVYLLDRLAFGPEPRELAAVLTAGEHQWLNARLAGGFDTPTEQTLLHAVCKQYPNAGDPGQTVHRALAEWIGSDNPVRSRFSAWAENHFSTWMTKIEGIDEWRSHLDFCRLGIAPFADLLSASAHSPAMLNYLDQVKSYASSLNENYAREIMELHTLGVHGGYTQTDVTALAGVLNGWTVTSEALLPQEDATLHLIHNTNGNGAGMEEEFRFAPVLSDGTGRRVFGMQFPPADPATRYDRVRLALEMLASHPSTAEHVCRKLAEHYVGDPAPDKLVHLMSGVYLESGGDLRAVLRAMVAQPAFWAATPKMATPFDYGVRMARLCRDSFIQTGGKPEQAAPKPEQIQGFLKRSGMGLFDRVTPDGYPQADDAYADSNALLQRWHFMEEQSDALNRLVPKHWRTLPVPAPPTAAPVVTAVPPPGASPAPTADAATTAEAAQRFIDLAAVRLTGRLLTPTSNQAALELLGQGNTPDQYSQALLFVSLLPETSLR